MKLKITACSDKAFIRATLPLGYIELAAGRPANDNTVLPQATHHRHLIPSYPASGTAQQGIPLALTIGLGD